MPPLVAVDVGCRWGFAEAFLNRMPAGGWIAYGFDPDEAECARLSAHYGALAPGRVNLVPKALAEAGGRRRLYLTEEPACSSLLEPDPDLTAHYPALHCARTVGTREIEVTTLADWAAAAGVTRVDYMKLDTQGTELEILKGAGALLDSVRCIDVEVEFNPIYLGQPLFADVDAFLRSRGFALWKLTNLVHYTREDVPNAVIGEDAICYDTDHRLVRPMHGGQLFWADARYVAADALSARPPRDPQRWRDDMLFRVLGAPDAAVHGVGTVTDGLRMI